MLRILILSNLLLLSTCCFGQTLNPSFEHLTTAHGLSQNTVIAILQDHQGFMWFGTGDGLNKYDGQNFTIYKHNSNDSLSLGENYIEVLYQDNDDNIWVGTWGGGLSLYNRDTDSFTNFISDSEDGDYKI